MPASIPSLDPHTLVRRHYPRASFLRPPGTGRGFVSVHKLEDFAHEFRLPVPPHRSQVYAVLLVCRGQLVRTDGLITYVVEPDMLYFDAPGQIMSVLSVSADCAGYFALFDADYFLHGLREVNTLLELPFFRFDHRPLVQLPATEAATVRSHFAQLETYFRQPNHPDQHALISTLLHLICLQAKQFCPAVAATDAASAAATLTHKFRRLLPVHIEQRRTVADYADLLAVTPDYLSKCVKRTTGQTAGELLTAMLVLEACVLLRHTELPVSAVAARFGFDDLSYFGRLIRRHTGFSPSQYRRQA